MINKLSAAFGKKSRPGFSLKKMLIVAAPFGAIGALLIIKSFAAAPASANLWIDTSAAGNTCVYHASPAPYSTNEACSTFDQAWDKAASGDVIVVKPGIYGPQKVNGDKTSETKFIGEGEDDNGVIIRNDDTECEHIYGANSAFCAQAAYMTLENMVLDTNSVFGANSAIRIWNDNSDGTTPFYNAHHVTLRNVDFWGTYPNMQVSASDFTWQGGSHGRDGVVYPKICSGGSEPIWLESGADRATIDGVRFNPKRIETSGCDPHIETIRLQGDVDDVTIKNSWFVGGSAAGSGHIFTGAGTTSNNIKIINNIFEPTEGSLTFQATGTCDWYFAYNTFLQTGFDGGCSGGNNQTWVGNIATTVPGCSGTHIKNVWQGSGSCGSDTFVANLGLGASGRIQAGSPAIDAGETPSASDHCTGANVGSRDFEGTARPQGSACDAGADELGAPAGQSANIWVDTNGGTCTDNSTPAEYNDAQACSWDQANDTCEAGDTVMVKAGNYGDVVLSGSNNRSGSGVCNIRMASGESVTLDEFALGKWSDQSTPAAGFLNIVGPAKSRTFYADFSSTIILDGWDVDAGGQAAATNQPFHVEAITGPFTLKNSKVHNSWNANSLAIINTNNNNAIVFDNNDFYDNLNNTSGSIHDECLYAYDVDSVTLTRNHFWGCNVMDVFLTGPLGTVEAANWRVENNIFEAPTGGPGNALSGIHFSGGSRTVKPNGFIVRHNTFGNTGMVVTADSNPTGSGMTVAGNYFYDSAPCGLPNTTYSYNVTRTGVSNCGGTGAQSFAESALNSGFVNYRADSGNGGGTSEPAGDYHLASSSPLINIGNTAANSYPATDKDGNSRPAGSAPDVGALEYTGSTPVTPPPPPPPGTLLLGNQTVEATADSLASQQTQAFPYTASASGNAGSVSVYIDSSNSAAGAAIGLYADSSGSPGSLLASASITSPVAGWNTAALSSNPVITSGSQYWIALLGTGSGTLAFKDRSGGPCTSKVNAAPNNWTSMKNPFGATGGDFNFCPASAYVTAATGTQTITGDLNSDGKVGIADLAILLSKWNTSDQAADINSDGSVNIFDFSIMLKNWGG